MALTFSVVDGAEHAATASGILNDAWQPPAMHYTPEYMRWQMSFPGPWPAPAVLASDGNTAVGFAGATPRRVRFGGTQYDAVIVSFVCVLPEYQGQGVAGGLYRCLLNHIAGLNCLVVTYTTPDSAGDRVLRRAYAGAGFAMHPIGEYALYARMATPPAAGPWSVSAATDARVLSACVERCAREDAALIQSDPTDAQIEHYQQDPRPRHLLVAVNESTGVQAAGWGIRFQMRGPNGLDPVLAMDSLIVPRGEAGALSPLLDTAADLLRTTATGPVVVAAPSVAGFSAVDLRSAGMRQTASKFVGFVCAPELPESIRQAQGTTLEVI